ncbi:hypothetical protein Pelo_13874 [Pelomyxa schiedti]|nr:hypothetical protein Pelo_13874 [Pelomyxa schiedti]
MDAISGGGSSSRSSSRISDNNIAIPKHRSSHMMMAASSDPLPVHHQHRVQAQPQSLRHQQGHHNQNLGYGGASGPPQWDGTPPQATGLVKSGLDGFIGGDVGPFPLMGGGGGGGSGSTRGAQQGGGGGIPSVFFDVGRAPQFTPFPQMQLPQLQLPIPFGLPPIVTSIGDSQAYPGLPKTEGMGMDLNAIMSQVDARQSAPHSRSVSTYYGKAPSTDFHHGHGYQRDVTSGVSSVVSMQPTNTKRLDFVSNPINHAFSSEKASAVDAVARRSLTSFKKNGGFDRMRTEISKLISDSELEKELKQHIQQICETSPVLASANISAAQTNTVMRKDLFASLKEEVYRSKVLARVTEDFTNKIHQALTTTLSEQMRNQLRDIVRAELSPTTSPPTKRPPHSQKPSSIPTQPKAAILPPKNSASTNKPDTQAKTSSASKPNSTPTQSVNQLSANSNNTPNLQTGQDPPSQQNPSQHHTQTTTTTTITAAATTSNSSTLSHTGSGLNSATTPTEPLRKRAKFHNLQVATPTITGTHSSSCTTSISNSQESIEPQIKPEEDQKEQEQREQKQPPKKVEKESQDTEEPSTATTRAEENPTSDTKKSVTDKIETTATPQTNEVIQIPPHRTTWSKRRKL